MSPKRKEVARPSAHKMRAICIISEGELVGSLSFLLAARELGKEMAARNITVVHGGKAQGLTAMVAMTSTIRRNDVLGITLENFLRSSSTNKPSFSLGRELKAQNPYRRIVYILRNSDAFIVMPGGLVNLEMFAIIMLWAKANLHKKPIGFLNINGFFDGLLTFITHAGKQGFISQEMCCLVASAPNVGQLIDRLQSLVRESNPSADQVVQYTGNKRKRGELDTDLHL